MKLSEILSKYRIETTVKDEIEYNQVTISQHTGVKYRGKKLGITIGRKRQFIVDLKKYPNTVMFTRQGLKDGAIGFAPKEVHNCIVTENMPTLSVNTDKVDVDYLKRLLNSNYFLKKISELTIVGSAQKSIHERDLLKLDINIPQIEFQKIIADKIISKEVDYFSLTTEIQIQKQLLTKLKQSILQEAIQGKLTVDWREQNPNTECATELLKRIKAEKEQLIKGKKIKKEKALPPITDKEIIFELPDGWVWCKIDSLVNSIKDDIRTGPFGTSLQKSEHRSTGIPVLGIESIGKQGAFTGKNKIYVNEEKAKELKSFEVNGLDIIISRSGTIGELCLLPKTIGRALISTNLMKISLNHEIIDPLFFCYLFEGSITIIEQMKELCKGSTRLFITQKILKNLFFQLPPLSEQKVIVERVNTLLQKCQDLEQKIETSEANAQMLMQAVLKEAFESEVEVVGV